MTDRPMMDTVEMYQMIREAITELQGDSFLVITNGTGVFTRLTALLPDETVERIRRDVIGELCVNMIHMRTVIRETLSADEQELWGSEEYMGVINSVYAIPKNDYRRHQNGQEDDDG